LRQNILKIKNINYEIPEIKLKRLRYSADYKSQMRGNKEDIKNIEGEKRFSNIRFGRLI
jgi:hypothetical protein